MPASRSKTDKTPVAIDVFSGVGGLTSGLKRAGFRVAVAVEIEPHAVSGYKTNHPEVAVLRQDVRTITGAALRRLAGSKIDLLAGCPPCQGFSSLTSKWRREDSRNELVGDMARLVEETRPRAVMMENVPGLANRGKPLFDEFVHRIENCGYKVSYAVLQLADYGVAQNRRRLVLLAGRGFHIPLPEPTHSIDGSGGLPRWRVVRDVISGRPKPVELQYANEHGGPSVFGWHVVRTLSENNSKRLRNARAGKQRFELPESMRPDCHKQSEKGFGNVYGRMRWNRVSPTITGGCTTLSKGRFGHPQRNTTISVREAAAIQQFPEDYIFDCPYMEHVCTMVGNALPCGFAEIASKACYSVIENQRGRAKCSR